MQNKKKVYTLNFVILWKCAYTRPICKILQSLKCILIIPDGLFIFILWFAHLDLEHGINVIYFAPGLRQSLSSNLADSLEMIEKHFEFCTLMTISLLLLHDIKYD